MPRTTKPYNPLDQIPTPDFLERHLAETEQLAARLRVLLRVAKELRQPNEENAPSASAEAEGVPG